MEQEKLVARIREFSGKRVGRLRRAGIVPAVLDRRGHGSLNIQINASDLVRVLKSEAGANALLDLTIEGGENPIETTALIRDLQRHHLSRQISHVEFQEVNLKEMITAHVPILQTGSDRRIKDAGGRVDQVLDELEVSAHPDSIPPHVEVDLTDLEPGDIVHAEQIPLPSGVERITPAETVVAIVRGRPIARIEAEGLEREEGVAAEI